MHIEAKRKDITALAKLPKLLMSMHLIRFWDSEFDILKPKKNAKGNRMFTPEDITNLQLIYHLLKKEVLHLKVPKHT
jgi:DNA-binding transcriptional MerR regulator